MRDLIPDDHGKSFTCIKEGRVITGKISFYQDCYYLCNDTLDGGHPHVPKFGYKYGWSIIRGKANVTKKNGISELVIQGSIINNYQIF